jgi:hypothetical protein
MTFSVFIPRVFLSISEETIQNIFWKLGYGKVSHVDFVKCASATGDYNRAYIYFEFLFDSPVAKEFQEKITTAKKTTVVYDTPWFWTVLPNTSKNPYKNKECVEFEEDEDEYEADEDEDEDEEDIEMSTLLDQMDEVAEFIPEETTELVSADYVNILELENMRLKIHLEDETVALTRLQKSTRTLIKKKEALVESDIYFREQILKMEQERMELQMELAHMKELLKQYEPDVRRQNKELVEF